MKVCIVNPGFHMGGAERITVELANNLSEKHNVSLIDFTGNNYCFYDVSTDVNLEFHVPKMILKRKIIRRLLNLRYRIYEKNLNPILMYKEQIEALCTILNNNNFDCIVLSQGLLTACIPYLKSKFPYLKIIAWQHNSYDVYVNRYHKNMLEYYLSGIEQADCVVCLTENDAEKFKKINPASICIYNFLTIEEPFISDVENKNIIFVGRLAIEQKGLDLLIDIAKGLDEDWKIQVAGDGANREEFRKMIINSSLEDKVILRGNLNSRELREFYSKGSIFISTSRWEGFGLVITEAMASGLPIVSFNNLGPNEILLNGKYGLLIENYNTSKFVNVLNQLIQDSNQRYYWKQKSLERAEDFKQEHIIKQWEEQLQTLYK